MKLKVFFAKDGDCLLLTSVDDRHVLVDGGRSSSFEQHARPVLQSMADAATPLDLVCVSHIDADHISGIISLLKDVSAWSVFDYQMGEGQNPAFPRPDNPRPPQILSFWHNSWRAQFGDLAGPIDAVTTRVAEAAALAPVAASSTRGAGKAAVDSIVDLAESISDGIRLVRLIEDETPIVRNDGFPLGLVLLRNPPHKQQVGSMTLTVLGPTQQHLKRLREEWEEWLETHPRSVVPDKPRRRRSDSSGAGLAALPADSPATIEEAGDVIADLATSSAIIEKSNAAKVTPPNRASITLLAEEGDVSMLLTGDAAEDEILEGLTAAGKLAGGTYHCTVLKVQHHGSEFNLSRIFTDQVVADHYVFCGDGAHENPSPSVVKTIVASRLQQPGPFTLWFNCSEERTLPGRRRAMRTALREARKAATRHSDRIEVKVLDDDRSFFEIEVQ